MEGHIRLSVAEYSVRLQLTQSGRLSAHMGTTLRGGLGRALRWTSCVQEQAACSDCLLQCRCAYGYLFETPVPPDSPAMRRYTHAPHPFVLRAPAVHPSCFEQGDTIDLSLLMVGRAADYFPFLLFALMHLGELGLGSDRLTFEIDEVRATADGVLVYENGRRGPVIPAPLTQAEAAVGPAQVMRFRLHYVTPLRLRVRETVLRHPEFSSLVSAALRRLQLLCLLHDAGDFQVDAAALVRLACSVRLVRDRTWWREISRHSTRQDGTMPMGGLMGDAEFEGDLGTFRAILALAGRVHVGKGTAFGHGCFQVEEDGHA